MLCTCLASPPPAQIKSDEEIARLPSMHDSPAALASDDAVGTSEAHRLFDAPVHPTAAASEAQAARAAPLGGVAAAARDKAGGDKSQGPGGLNVGFGDDVGWGI